ncbi:MAG: hypothetical protein AMXMBFR53_14730 [Gemmatimonadota bacterium]
MTARPMGRLPLVLVLAVVYALCYSVIKAGLEYAPPLRFAGLRTVAAGFALLAYLGLSGHRPLLPPRSTWPGLLALSAIGTVVLYAAMFMSPGVTGAGIASVLGNTGPLFAVALATPVLGERVTSRKAVALVVGTAGAILVAYPAVTDPNAPGLLGALLPVTAAAAAAGSAVLLKWLSVGDDLMPVVGWQLLIGGVVLLGASALLETDHRVSWSVVFWGYLAFLAVPGTAFASAAWYWLVQREDVGRISIILMVLVPALGLGLAWAFFGETVRPLSLAGVALALVGVGLAAGGHGEAAIRPGSGEAVKTSS